MSKKTLETTGRENDENQGHISSKTNNNKPSIPAGRMAHSPDIRKNLPAMTHQGVLVIGESEIPCYVLQDERRVLSGRAVTQAMGLTSRDQGMSRFLASKTIRPFMSQKLVDAIENPIVFTINSGTWPAQGFEAFVLPELCHAIIDADAELKSGLPRQQATLARQARILSRGFATVGITALVDEATGYQEVRDRKALHEILARYISDELLEWSKMFPDEFYKELFRLRGWQYRNMSVKRPVYVGKLTVDLVYKRLAPGVYQKLKEVNPRNEKGRLSNHYHQWLTDAEGKPALDRHIFTVTALMRASTNWDGFMRLMNRSLPLQSQNLLLPGLEHAGFKDDDE